MPGQTRRDHRRASRPGAGDGRELRRPSSPISIRSSIPASPTGRIRASSPIFPPISARRRCSARCSPPASASRPCCGRPRRPPTSWRRSRWPGSARRSACPKPSRAPSRIPPRPPPFRALIAAREKALDWTGNEDGLSGKPPLIVYASTEAHSSVDKAARIAGYGMAGLSRVPVDDAFRMRPDALDAMIAEDRAAGRLPAAVRRLDRRHRRRRRRSAAPRSVRSPPATASICMSMPPGPARRSSARNSAHLAAGIEAADSIVFNPHKWMVTNFDCSAHFVRDPAVAAQGAVHPAGLSGLRGQQRRPGISRLDGPARPPLPRAQAVVRAEELRPRGHPRHDPQPCRLGRRTGGTHRRRRRTSPSPRRQPCAGRLPPHARRRRRRGARPAERRPDRRRSTRPASPM